MMLRRFSPAARLPCGRHAQVVRLSASSQHWQPSSGPVAAALAAAYLLMGSPAWAIIEDPPSGTPSTYEQELQQLIETRTGKTALPELNEIPGEKAIQEEVERAFIAEAAAAEEEVVVVLKVFEPEPVSGVKEQAIRDSLAAQKAAPAPETVIKPDARAGPAGFSQSTVIVVGAVATVGIAAVALSSSGSPAAAPAPPAAAPSDPPPAPATPPTDTTPPPPLA